MGCNCPALEHLLHWDQIQAWLGLKTSWSGEQDKACHYHYCAHFPWTLGSEECQRTFSSQIVLLPQFGFCRQDVVPQPSPSIFFLSLPIAGNDKPVSPYLAIILLLGVKNWEIGAEGLPLITRHVVSFLLHEVSGHLAAPSHTVSFHTVVLRCD